MDILALLGFYHRAVGKADRYFFQVMVFTTNDLPRKDSQIIRKYFYGGYWTTMKIVQNRFCLFQPNPLQSRVQTLRHTRGKRERERAGSNGRASEEQVASGKR
jgi:hypothetical protein